MREKCTKFCSLLYHMLIASKTIFSDYSVCVKIFVFQSLLKKQNGEHLPNTLNKWIFCLQFPKSPTQMGSLSFYISVRNISCLGSFKDKSFHHHLERLRPLTQTMLYDSFSLSLSSPRMCVCVHHRDISVANSFQILQLELPKIRPLSKKFSPFVKIAS